MLLRMGVAGLLSLFAIGPALALRQARTDQERRPAMARLVFWLGLAGAVLLSDWSPAGGFVLVLVSGAAIVWDVVDAARAMRRARGPRR